MSVNRQDLLKALLAAKPSLGGSDGVIPILSHFCFMGDVVYAWSDVTATIVPIETGMTCALHGDTLIGVLAAMDKDDVTIGMQDGNATINVGTGTVKVPKLDAKDFLFDPPAEETVFDFIFGDDAIKAMGVCLQSTGSDTMRPEYMGVTVRATKEGVFFYSTNNTTATRYALGLDKVKKPGAVVLPVEACQQMVKLNQGSSEFGTVEVAQKTASITFSDGVTLVCKLIPAKIDMMDKVFRAHVDNARFFALPPQLEAELRRAEVLLSKDGVKEAELAFAKGMLTISVAGTLGTMRTAVSVADKAVDAKVYVNPEVVLRILGHVDQIAVNDNQSLVFHGGGLDHVISSMARVRKEEAPAPAVKAGRPTMKPRPNIEEDDIPF